jgi:ankyrin repeat protein
MTDAGAAASTSALASTVSSSFSTTASSAAPSKYYASKIYAEDFTGALCHFAQRGNLQRLRAIWPKGSCLPIIGTEDALLYAVANGHEECVGFFLGCTYAYTHKSRALSEGLELAAAHGNIGMVCILVAAGADPDVDYGRYGSPLRLAAAHGHAHVVRLLLRCKAVPRSPYPLMRTAACEAARHGHCSVLAKIAYAVKKTLTTSLAMAAHAAAEADQVDALRVLLAVKVHVDSKRWDDDGRTNETPLHFAVRAEAHGAAEYLVLQAKANIEACDSQLRTALWMAAGKKSCRMLRLLLRAKANVDWHSDDPHGCYVSTPLGEAAKHGIAAHVRLLLRAKADPTIADANACTPATHAERRGDVAMAALLRGQVP